MPSLSIKNAPDHVLKGLRRRAERNHRSLQGELMSIITIAAVDEDTPHPTPSQIVAEFRAKDYASPDESVAMIREDRDRADGRR